MKRLKNSLPNPTDFLTGAIWGKLLQSTTFPGFNRLSSAIIFVRQENTCAYSRGGGGMTSAIKHVWKTQSFAGNHSDFKGKNLQKIVDLLRSLHWLEVRREFQDLFCISARMRLELNTFKSYLVIFETRHHQTWEAKLKWVRTREILGTSVVSQRIHFFFGGRLLMIAIKPIDVQSC